MELYDICLLPFCVPAHLCPTLGDPVDCSPPGSSVHGIFQARILESVAISFLLQGTFLTQGSNPGLLHYRWIFYHLNHQESPIPTKQQMFCCFSATAQVNPFSYLASTEQTVSSFKSPSGHDPPWGPKPSSSTSTVPQTQLCKLVLTPITCVLLKRRFGCSEFELGP